jgi:hypothetical protein
VQALIGEAMKKATIAWLTVASHHQYAVWCAWSKGGLQVVSGPGEQPAPGLATAAEAIVTARGDHGGKIVSWRAVVTRLVPGTAEWEEFVPALAARRLNSAPAPELVHRWAKSCLVSRLTPVDDAVITQR